MCAIDCFYVPSLTDSDVTIYSTCHVCEREIEVQIAGQQALAVEPTSALVWDSDAPYDCPKTNFFCHQMHLDEWREQVPNELGEVCSIDRALQRGRVAAARIKQIIGG
jgi:hypothetical protein